MARMRSEALLPVGPLLLAFACSTGTPTPLPHTVRVADAAPEGAPDEEWEEDWEDEVQDGAWLYERNCSGCHGMEGKGDGQTGIDLGVQPRDFAAGGFSFGNTPEDLFRTISAGIPGRSVMPAFGGLLTEEERWLIVGHLRTLMPQQEVQDPAASVLHVGDRAAIARGKLPPAAEGRPELPRGLLLGLPSGLTFEYDVQDVAPVAVRLGAFADREDWRGRGGGYLEPLGSAIYLWNRAPAFKVEGVALRAQLTASTAEADAATLEYDLVDGSGRVRASVTERLTAVPLSVGGAFRRALDVRAADAGLTLDIDLAGDERTRFERAEGDWCSGPREVGPDGARDAEAVWLDLPQGAIKDLSSGALRVRVGLAAGAEARLAATLLLLPDDSLARLAALAEEIAR